MPKHVIYKGPAQNIGRFGWVEPGTGLILTDREAEAVSKDKRFGTNKDPEVPTKSSPVVERENAHEKVVALELREKSKAELLASVEELRKAGQTVNVSKNPTVAELIRVIEASRPMTDQRASRTHIARSRRSRPRSGMIRQLWLPRSRMRSTRRVDGSTITSGATFSSTTSVSPRYG